ncbi:MAG: FMN-binding protein [Lentisphaeria bacterium]|nr:FMN-binding protein [Lentisphaeria bacterium]
MRQTATLTIGLGLTCLLAAGVLAVANLVTEAPRRRAEARERLKSLEVILPRFANDPVADAKGFALRDRDGRDGGTVIFYPARDGSGPDARLLGFAAEAASGKGFGGEVRILAGIATDGTVTTVLVTSHAETPGLGTKVTDRARTRYIWEAFRPPADEGLPPSKYLDQYSTRPLAALASADFRVVAEGSPGSESTVEAITGATVSSRAVADAVALVAAAFEAHRGELLAP